jgi:uncharacterized membrane protein YgcG
MALLSSGARAACAAAALLLLLALTAPCGAVKAWSPVELPSPQSDGRGVCGRGGKKSAICDPDGVLPPDAADVLDGIANFIAEGSHGFAKADCAGSQKGYQVAAAVFHRMRADERSVEERVRYFAKELHDSWGVGDARCNNGVVLVVALDDRRMYISTGAGAKGVLTDNAVQAVLNDMRGALRAGRVDFAMQTGLADIGKVLAGSREVGGFSVATGAKGLGASDIWTFSIVGFFLLICFRMSRATTPREQYRRCQAALRRLEEDRTRARQNVFEGQAACPICLEDFEKRSPPPSPAASIVAAPAVPDGVRQRPSIAGAATACAAGEDGEASESETLLSGGEVASAATATATTTITTTATTSAELQESEQALRCGHKFHKACLTAMLRNGSSGDKCPVCRRPMFGPEPRRGDAAGEQRPDDSANDGGGDVDIDLPSGRAQGGQRHHPDQWQAFYPEYMFRLQRLNFMYPHYVTNDMVTRWGNPDYAQPLATDAQFRALEPPVVQQARASGSGGSSFSFSGGSSMGGGGGGSSW